MLQIIWEPILFQKLIQLYSAAEKPKPSGTLKPLPSMGLADELRRESIQRGSYLPV